MIPEYFTPGWEDGRFYSLKTWFTLDNKKTNIRLLRPSGPHKQREMDCVKYLAQRVTVTWHTHIHPFS